MASRILSNSMRVLNRAMTLANKPAAIRALTFNNINSRAFSVAPVSMQQTNVMKDLASFLTQEIKLETEARKNKGQLPKIAGFNAKTEGPNVVLTKSFNDETITVKFSVNSSLDNSEPDIEEAIEKENSGKENEPSAMKSRPTFTVDVKKDGQVLSFWCSFLLGEDGKEEASEDFQIDEFAVHEGEWNENVYSADCSVLDGQLYDILLNLLEERGVGETFANELAEFSTSYEHQQYIGLLEKLSKFATK